MRINRFIGKGVHGVLDFDIEFNSDLTFLTGINGSGKTTVVNCIVALMTPDLEALAGITYTLIRVEFKNDKQLYIECKKSDGTITLKTSAARQTLAYQSFISDTPSSRETEFETEYYKALLSSSASHEVMKFIGSIPTPMFLGLDRGARFGDEVRRRFYTPPIPRLGRKAFGTSLVKSLADAASLAESCHRDNLIRAGEVRERLRRALILELLEMEPSQLQVEGALKIASPSTAELRKVDELDKIVQDLPNILGIGKEEISKRIDPFISMLKKISTDLRRSKVNNILPNDVHQMASLFNWAVNNSQIKRITAMSHVVSKYNEEISIVLRQSDNYLNIVNTFLKDSNKKVQFDQRGHIYFSMGESTTKHAIDALSSGEAQIFVILTHLSFNSQVKSDNVLIIDEPELSLHVQWQELFVDSVLSANGDVQYIMATHSPSIVLERIDKCKDVNQRQKKNYDA